MDANNSQYRKKLLKLKELRERSGQRRAPRSDSLAQDAYEHGCYLYDNEQVEEAAELFQRLALQHPTWDEAWLALGIAEFRLRRFDRAYTSLSVCWMMRNSNPRPLYYLALVCLQTDRRLEARGLLQQVLAIAGRAPEHFELEQRAAEKLKGMSHE